MKIKTGDKVRVLSGKDRGKTGKITQVFPRESLAVVEGVNKIKKHLKTKKQGEKGQIIELFAPVKNSKLMLICPKCEKGVRVGFKLEAGKKHRFCRACKQFID